MSTSQRVWLVILLTVFGGLAIEQLTDMDTTSSIIVGVVAGAVIATVTSVLLLVKKPAPCPVRSDVEKK